MESPDKAESNVILSDIQKEVHSELPSEVSTTTIRSNGTVTSSAPSGSSSSKNQVIIDTIDLMDDGPDDESPNSVIENVGTEEDNNISENDAHDILSSVVLGNLDANCSQDIDRMLNMMEGKSDYAKPIQPIEPVKKVPGIHKEKGEAYSLLAQGKRNLMVKDYRNAVKTLGDACNKISKIYGEFALECADAYFSYGVSLLELHREKNDMTEQNSGDEDEHDEDDDDDDAAEGDQRSGDEGNGDDPKSGDEQESEVEEEEDDRKSAEECEVAEEENETDKVASSDTKMKDSALIETNNTVDLGKPGTSSSFEEKSVDNVQPGPSTAVSSEEEAASTDIQIAWEVLEMAKEIFKRNECESKLADTYLKLGEVGMESENYELAVSDIEQALAIRNKLLQFDNRIIAEIHYQLGIAYSTVNNFDGALEHLEKSKQSLQTRINKLERNEYTKEELPRDPFYKSESECEEIKEILVSIDEKIEEVKMFVKERIQSMMEASSSASSCSSTKVNDISHLVRKKRKAEGDDEDDNVSKVPRREE